MQERTEARERAATLRAGLVASAIYNVHRKKGTRPFAPEDFVKTPVQYVDGEELRDIVHSWLRKGSAKA